MQRLLGKVGKEGAMHGQHLGVWTAARDQPLASEALAEVTVSCAAHL